MRVELLGPLRVEADDGAETPVAAGRQRALLARLALEPGRSVTTEALVDALWPDDPPANAAGALHTQLSRLRRVLGDRIVHGPGGYRLTGVDTDAEAFETAAAQAEAESREDSPAAVRDTAAAALALWRGPALAGLEAGAFAEAAAVRLTARRETVAALLIEARLRLDGADAVLADLAARHAADPLGEPDAARYMRALAASGRRAEALAVYEDVRAKLADDLGVDPSPVLAEAHLDVLRGIAPAAPEPAPSRLPQPLTACVGREGELAAIADLLETRRLVTLTGPGGTGKTRLAVEAAHRLAAAGHAVRAVELAPVTDPDRLPEVFLDAIGHTESVVARRADDPAARLTEALVSKTLQNRGLLLVVDNCEHIVEGAAALIARVLARVPDLRVLATSREALGVSGETVLAVGPLTLPGRDEPLDALLAHASIRLFEERARQSDPGFAVDAANAAAVVDVCTALDGLPLAIELAAARLKALSLNDLAARLDDRFGLLARGPRTAEPRQRTLRAVVDWSWDLLDPTERAVLARMSVFNGSADLDAACEVCSATADDIAGLVEKSLVQRLPEGRYRLLETVREYAAARLSETGETAARYERHAEHYTALAEAAEPHLMRAEQVDWLERLAADHGNLTAAIRRMIAVGNAPAAYRAIVPLSWYWWMRGHRVEGQRLADEVRAMPGEVEPLQRASIVMAGTWGLWSGWLDPAEMDARLAGAEALCEEHGLYDREPLLIMIPIIRALLNNDESGIRAHLAALDPERHAWIRGIALLFLSEYSERANGPGAALADLTEANRIFTALGERFGLIITLQSLAAGRMAAGDYPGARALVLRALAAEAELGADLADSAIAEFLWRIDARHGDDPAAVLERMREVAARAAHVGNTENVVAARVAAAICLRRLGRPDDARDELLQAEPELPRYLEFTEVAVHLYRELADLARESGDPDLEARAASMLKRSNWPFSS